jgi:hypothetical protein
MRDPENEAFFTAEGLENLSEALVREGIQNSLDASASNNGPRNVHVKIRFVKHSTAGVSNYLNEIFRPVLDNFSKGLNIEKDFIEENLGDNGMSLVFEDFGTKGLTGDVTEVRIEPSRQNAFFSFFRAEGRSGKDGDRIGRWGIGKQVFPTSSQLHAIIGVSVRNETPEKVLMGSAVVRSHCVADQDYQPDAWFGIRSDEQSAVMPLEDHDGVDYFCNVFGLDRRSQPGLSVVIPAVDPRIKVQDLINGVLKSFFWPILKGELSLSFVGPDGDQVDINATTISEHVGHLETKDAGIINCAVWAASIEPEKMIVLDGSEARVPKWTESREKLLSEEKIDQIRTELESTGRVGVRVPILVRVKATEEETKAHFDVFLERTKDPESKTVFLRDGIVITDVRSPSIAGSRSMVVASHEKIARLLGDSEGVNHTQWQKDSPKFHNIYIYGPDSITFVTRSAYEISRGVQGADSKGDPTLLRDYFSIPDESGEKERARKEKPGSKPPQPIPPPPPPRKSWYTVKQDVRGGGFVISPGDEESQKITVPFSLRIKLGYDVRSGNPIKKWSPADFEVNKDPICQNPDNKGIEIEAVDGNELTIKILSQDFTFGLQGFDKHRDLEVRVNKLTDNNEEDF